MLEKFIFIALDECCFYPNEDPRYGYSLKGTRTISKRPRSKGDKRYTILFAISSLKEKGVICWKPVEGSANWQTFYDFLKEINPIGNQKNYLLMDNSSIHTAPDKRAKAKLPSVKEKYWSSLYSSLCSNA